MIRRLQVQLRPGQMTTPFIATVDLDNALLALADHEGKEALAAVKPGDTEPNPTKKYHQARREAFLEALQIVTSA